MTRLLSSRGVRGAGTAALLILALSVPALAQRGQRRPPPENRGAHERPDTPGERALPAQPGPDASGSGTERQPGARDGRNRASADGGRERPSADRDGAAPADRDTRRDRSARPDRDQDRGRDARAHWDNRRDDRRNDRDNRRDGDGRGVRRDGRGPGGRRYETRPFTWSPGLTPYATGLGLGFFYNDGYPWRPFGGYYRGPGYGYSTVLPVEQLGAVRLDINGPRDAQVFVDGYFAGVLDDFDGAFQALELEEGGYRVEVVAPGYEPLTVDVRIQSGRKLTYRGTLERMRERAW